ncbi:diacylglycerol kinase family protein [uncultured Dysosmobacter sp.]|uniref:diacylglycerol/lipid kinase family protein n=1 Tax=uncultured Dysosmobacter sp. TaxID=2591384 RepID=UPI002617EB1A|nr:diacylglycerol kinase family protein [uncultured Dysosmobacter sp.]
MRHIFIINPYAGKQDQTARIYGMADRLRDVHGLDCACMLTDRPGGASAMARKLAETGEAVRLYACGGDGTVSEVANGIAGFPNAAMTCIPAGTGNDFLKNFGPDRVKFADAENLWAGEVFPLDLIDCNGRYCVTIACNGIDARVADSVHQFSRAPLLSGRGSYLASVAANFLFRPIGRRWTVWLDGEKLEDDFALVSTCNGRHYGGGSTPVPEARMDDSVLNTVLIKNVSKLTFARLFSAYSAGEHSKLPPELIQVVTAGEVRIQAEQDIISCVDGECFRSREVVIRLADKRLNFFGPKGCDPNATAR